MALIVTQFGQHLASFVKRAVLIWLHGQSCHAALFLAVWEWLSSHVCFSNQQTTAKLLQDLRLRVQDSLDPQDGKMGCRDGFRQRNFRSKADGSHQCPTPSICLLDFGDGWILLENKMTQDSRCAKG